jgi:hypothetical protein
MKNITPQTHSPQEFQRIRDHQANGMVGLPLVGDPDAVARDIARLAELGLRGIAVSFVNYLDELPYFCAEVLPRLARARLRDSRIAGRVDYRLSQVPSRALDASGLATGTVWMGAAFAAAKALI